MNEMAWVSGHAVQSLQIQMEPRNGQLQDTWEGGRIQPADCLEATVSTTYLRTFPYTHALVDRNQLVIGQLLWALLNHSRKNPVAF